MARFARSVGVLLLLGLAGCGGSSGAGGAAPAATQSSEGKASGHKIVATTGMVADLTRQVVGEAGTVEGMMGPGVDPHLYQPNRSDVAAVLAADAVFYNGLMLEGKMGTTLERARKAEKLVYAVAEGLSKKRRIAPGENVDYDANYDPHVWMDVERWGACVQAAAERLAKFDPERAELYRANARAYRERLRELDAYVERVIGSIPEKQRVLVTAHDAFSYFGKAYGIDVRGVQGISTNAEAGLGDINNLVDFLVDREVPAVFVETSVAQKNVEALIEGARERGHTVRIGGSLFSDAMGPRGTYEGTYLGMMDHNATTIARALGGEAPKGGWQGELAGAAAAESEEASVQ